METKLNESYPTYSLLYLLNLYFKPQICKWIENHWFVGEEIFLWFQCLNLTELEEEESTLQTPKPFKPFLDHLMSVFLDLRSALMVVLRTIKKWNIVRCGWINLGVFIGEGDMDRRNVKNSWIKKSKAVRIDWPYRAILVGSENDTCALCFFRLFSCFYNYVNWLFGKCKKAPPS